MKNILLITIIGAIFLTASCKNESTNETSSEAKLLFKSGFESGVYIDNRAYVDNEDYRYIKGRDKKSGFSWPIDILGSSSSGLHYISDDNHEAVFSKLQRVVGHNGDYTTALFQKENYEFRGDTQCPYEILNIKEGTKDLYIRYWIKLDSESLIQPNMWRTFFEYKTKGYAENKGFRLIAFIYTDDDGTPYWV